MKHTKDTLELRDKLAEAMVKATKKWWEEKYGMGKKVTPWNQLEESNKMYYRRLVEAVMNALKLSETDS